MIQTVELSPGITLRCFPDNRFKHGCLSVQLVRPMCREEAALNALLPAVLLRGCESCPDLRRITLRLDDLYGASVGALVRRVGDYQTTGLYASFTEDRFAMEGDAILAPMVEFVRQLLLEPVLEEGAFCHDFVESEKKNLISTIESRLNNKGAYAMEQLYRHMGREDTFGIPRLGEKEDVEAITARSLYDHYRKILRSSPIALFYVGSARPETVAGMLAPMFAGTERALRTLPAQTGFHEVPGRTWTEQMDVNQGKLCMGFVTHVTLAHPDFAAMQVLNGVFGGGMTGKLFTHIREKLALCYAISSGYHSAKGIVTVSAGIDSGMDRVVEKEVLAQLDACCRGEITPEELLSAKEALRSSLLAVHDAPGAIENYYSTGVLSGHGIDPATYLERVENVTAEQVCRAAQSLRLHSVFFLKGVGP